MFVNVYEVTREFGGFEEGGWYYNWYNCVETIKLTEYTDEDEIILGLEEKYQQLENDAYDILIEDKPKESQTLKAPIYE